MQNLPLSSKPERLSLFDSTVTELEEMLYGNQYKPGDKIPSERELCDLIGVSRTVLRESLRILEYRGLITVFPGKGAYVRKPTIENNMFNIYGMMRLDKMSFEHYVEMRQVLEPNIARLAAQKSDEHTITILEEELRNMVEYLSKGEREKYILCDQNFHMQLALVTENPMLMTVQHIIIKGFVQVHGYIHFMTGSTDLAMVRHNEIFNAVKNGDPQMAYQAMELHVRQIEEQYHRKFVE